MKYKQNFKIMQITDKTLVIGVDIAKKVHFARAFDWRGIEVAKTFNFKATSTGFSEFKEWAREIAKKNGKDKIVVGFEPTGHYCLQDKTTVTTVNTLTKKVFWKNTVILCSLQEKMEILLIITPTMQIHFLFQKRIMLTF